MPRRVRRETQTAACSQPLGTGCSLYCRSLSRSRLSGSLSLSPRGSASRCVSNPRGVSAAPSAMAERAPPAAAPRRLAPAPDRRHATAVCAVRATGAPFPSVLGPAARSLRRRDVETLSSLPRSSLHVHIAHTAMLSGREGPSTIAQKPNRHADRLPSSAPRRVAGVARWSAGCAPACDEIAKHGLISSHEPCTIWRRLVRHVTQYASYTLKGMNS